MLMFLVAGGWSPYLATIPRMVWVLVRPGRTISTASGKGFWWIQRHGGWGNNNGTDVIPLMVAPLMLDLMDFRRMMCNISVPIRLLVSVQNGREAMPSLCLQELERVYGWSGRLVVSRHPENIG
ncbi:putative beta galactofuranosyl glycosyltransferase [Trypanosoma cruzi]|uniref:Putative beta galactofuranosyl glycosyltransferase n=1 Tax=Trypanosoma cruzi TaxID=5693 RepID=A0A2V2UUK5_TRYCR|nr:putative beta galactofuranosyl glycosyltransferase [Trypanosoma cruzi]PWU88264.1 putative beta galactofuranosyl glycosyltransferase [Trypanosoma cruzi]